jgi:ABC-type branched-subunit amino acid transport system substrate-binding protein
MSKRPSPLLHRFPYLCLFLAVGVASACGTTVPNAASGAAGGSQLNPSFSAAAPPGGADVSAGSTAGASAPGGAAPPSSNQPGLDRAAPEAGSASGLPGSVGNKGDTSAAGARIPESGPGWDSKHIYLGVMTQKDFQSAAASLGYSGIDPGDTRAQAQAVIDDVNRHGGVFGRSLALRTFDVATIASAQSPESYAQAACTHFTEDAPVVAVINIVLTMDTSNFRHCFAKRHVPLFNAGNGGVSRSDRALAPYFYSLGTPAWEVLAPVLVRRLQAQNYFQGWNPRTSRATAAGPVIGVLVADTITGHEDEAALVASLKAAGFTKIFTYAYPPPGSDIDGAVLNFEQNGVTHVISADIELVTFQIHAQNQGYAPRYGINTYNAPGLNLTQLGPKQQQIGEVGVGYAPAFDVVAAHEPKVMGGGVGTCRAMMAKAHVKNSDRLADAFALLVCDAVRLAEEGMVEGRGLSGAAVSAGAMAAGPSFQPAFAFRSGLSTKRQFMPAEVRDLAYVQACSCFKYQAERSFGM